MYELLLRTKKREHSLAKFYGYRLRGCGYRDPVKCKGKIFYGQEPPSGESTSTECGVNYQLLVAIIIGNF